MSSKGRDRIARGDRCVAWRAQSGRLKAKGERRFRIEGNGHGEQITGYVAGRSPAATAVVTGVASPADNWAGIRSGHGNTIAAPAAIQIAPARRATHRPHGVSFSRRTSSAKSAIQSTFITPTTNKSAMRTQQQPTQ